MAKERLQVESLAGLRVETVTEGPGYLNCLFYGDSGTGKTTLAGSASEVEDMSPVLLIDIEGGRESLRHSYPNVQFVRVTTWNEMQEVYNELYEGNHPFKTVILDSLTEIQKFSMYEIMRKLTADKTDRAEEVPSMREWGINLEQTRKLVRGFRDLEMHTIFTALTRVEKNARTGVEKLQPSLSGKMAAEVAAFLDFVGYYYVKQVSETEEGTPIQERFLLTQATETHTAKDRSGKMPQVIVKPTMQTIYEFFRGVRTIEDEDMESLTPDGSTNTTNAPSQSEIDNLVDNN